MDQRLYEGVRPSDFDSGDDLDLLREYQDHRVVGFACRKSGSRISCLREREYCFRGFDNEGLRGIVDFANSVEDFGALGGLNIRNSEGPLIEFSSGSFYSRRTRGSSGEGVRMGFELNVLDERGESIRENFIRGKKGFLMYFYWKFPVNREIDMEEYLSLACEALVDSMDTFDPNRGYKFFTHAYPRLAHIGSRAVGRSGNDYLWYGKIKTASGWLDSESGRSWLENVPFPDEKKSYYDEWPQLIRKLKRFLIPREVAVLVLRYLRGRTLEETAKILARLEGAKKVGKERIRYIEERALGRLRCYTSEGYWKD